MSRRLLAIESATDWLSVSLHEGGRVVDLREAEGTRQHASALMPLIAGMLDGAGWALADLGGLAASVGPGSFTSLRIGLATLKGLAFGRDLPVVGVSTLEAVLVRLAVCVGDVVRSRTRTSSSCDMRKQRKASRTEAAEGSTISGTAWYSYS